MKRSETIHTNRQVRTHTQDRLTALCPRLPGWAGTRKAIPVWILLKQEAVSGSGISWAICMSAPRSRQITMPAPHHSVFYRPDALPATQPTASKHWRQVRMHANNTMHYQNSTQAIWHEDITQKLICRNNRSPSCRPITEPQTYIALHLASIDTGKFFICYAYVHCTEYEKLEIIYKQ